jgi:hypothetical protein
MSIIAYGDFFVILKIDQFVLEKDKKSTISSSPK